MSLNLKWNLSERSFSRSLVLKTYHEEGETPSVEAELAWAWNDDPNMRPQPLGRVKAGATLEVPFDMKGRAIRIFTVSKTAAGEQSALSMREGTSKVFEVPTVPVILSAVFDDGKVVLAIDNAGGGGTIRIYRQLGSGGYSLLASIPATQDEYIDTAFTINGTYSYKLTQDGLPGESNVKSAAVDIGSGGTGAAPSDLYAVFDGTDTTDLSWTNNGGTGDNIIERKPFGGTFSPLTSVASSATSVADFTPQGPSPQVLTYRVYNTSATGYSNEWEVTIPKTLEPI